MGPAPPAAVCMWLHPTLTHPPPPVITPACPPAGRLSWVLHQHQAGYKSHYIITAPRYAFALRPAHRAPSIGRWGSAVSLHETNVHSTVRPASLPATADWGTGALLELSIRRFPVRLALNAAPCDALNAERSGALHTNRDAEQAHLLAGTRRPRPNSKQVKLYTGRLQAHLCLQCIFWKELSIIEGTERQTKCVWGICSFCCGVFLAERVCTGEDKQPHQPLSDGSH